MPKGINWNEQFYKLLRLSLGLTQEFSVDVDADGWRRLYQTAISHSPLAAATNQDMPTRRHTKRAFSAKECKNYQIVRVVVQSFPSS